MRLNEAAFHAPKTFRGQVHGYVCHSACVYWAVRALGKESEEAARLTDQVTRRNMCLFCTKSKTWKAVHTISEAKYAALVCTAAVQCPDDQVEQEIKVGDVILVAGKIRPAHSMICVSTGPIRIRGYNNQQSFRALVPQPPANAYDDATRDLSSLEVMGEKNFFRIPGSAFVEAVRLAIG